MLARPLASIEPPRAVLPTMGRDAPGHFGQFWPTTNPPSIYAAVGWCLKDSKFVKNTRIRFVVCGSQATGVAATDLSSDDINVVLSLRLCSKASGQFQ